MYVIGCASKTDLRKITVLQKKAIRIISNSNYNAHTKPIFNDLKILPFNNILYEQKMLFMHGIYNKYAPPPLLS